jgi:TolB-like protein
MRQRVWARTNVPSVHSLAVLPLRNLSGDPGQDYFAAGMTDELITYLSQVSNLRVISYTSTYRYKETKKSLPEIAQELGVDAVVEGSVQRAGGRLRINAQLVYAPKETHLWAQSYDRDLSDALEVQSKVAGEIAEQLRMKLISDARPQSERPVSLKAVEAYLQGNYHLAKIGPLPTSDDEATKAIAYFQEAIGASPDFA